MIFPNLEDPAGLATAIVDFLATTEPSRFDDADWGAVVAQRQNGDLRP